MVAIRNLYWTESISAFIVVGLILAGTVEGSSARRRGGVRAGESLDNGRDYDVRNDIHEHKMLYKGAREDDKASREALSAPVVGGRQRHHRSGRADCSPAYRLSALPTTAPKPDPAGTATGDKTTAVDAAGNPFVVTEPTDKTAPDYAQNKKAFDDYQAQAAKEPLAVKLADSVGHVRIATNFAWTLNTGYLVLFMQAGFALLTCGLVRKKNAAHLMMLNFAAYVFAFLAYYAVGYAFQFGAVAINAAPTNLGGVPTLNHFLIGSGQWGFVGGKGFFLAGPAYDAPATA